MALLENFQFQQAQAETPEQLQRWVLDILSTLVRRIVEESADLGAGGILLQEAWATDSILRSGTTQIPRDNTIPQQTEGDQYLTVNITPTDAANYLVVDVGMNLSSPGFGQIQMALFKDTGMNAICAVTEEQNATGAHVKLTYRMLAGATAQTTFKVRAGTNSAGTLYVNGSNASGWFGGVEFSFIRVQEIAA